MHEIDPAKSGIISQPLPPNNSAVSLIANASRSEPA